MVKIGSGGVRGASPNDVKPLADRMEPVPDEVMPAVRCMAERERSGEGE